MEPVSIPAVVPTGTDTSSSEGIEYLVDGLAVEDAFSTLLDADEGKPQRQLHGIDADGEFAFSGAECCDW